MEKITELKTLHTEAARFRILPLWSWTLGAIELSDGTDQYWGFALDRSRHLALAKAESEAIERSVFHLWERTGVSPFTGQSVAPPAPTSGFAAHSDATEARLRAFLEWRERAALQLASLGKFGLTETQAPNLGLLFQPALRSLRCELRLFVSPNAPYVSFALGTLQDQGVIFGSACRMEQASAIEAATVECLRKLAFIDQWRKTSDESNELTRTAQFWLSLAGVTAAQAFCRQAEASPGVDGVPANGDPIYLMSTMVRNRTVSCYFDPRFGLPEVSECRVPLL